MSVADEVRRTWSDRDFWRGMGVAVAAGVVLSLTGAFQSGEVSLARRLIYWVPLMAAGGLWGQVCSRWIGRHVDQDERPWLTVLLMVLTISGPVGLLVWSVTGQALNDRPLPLAYLPYLIVPVVTITTAVSAINVFLETGRSGRTQAAAPDAAPARFPQRLPPRLRGAAIHAVQAEDHYLRVHTDRGSDLILMRLSDAVAELEGLEGAQTHRSWWVARDAVMDVARGDGRAVLTLKDGLTAPVSRRHSRLLRAQGWY